VAVMVRNELDSRPEVWGVQEWQLSPLPFFPPLSLSHSWLGESLPRSARGSSSLQRHLGSDDIWRSGYISCRIWSCVGHCKIRCSAACFFCTVAVGTCSGVLTPNAMEVRSQQRRVVSANLCKNESFIN